MTKKNNDINFKDATIVEFDTHLKVLQEIVSQSNTNFRKGVMIFIFFIVSLGIMVLTKTIESNQKMVANDTPVSNELRDQLFREKEKNDQLANEIKEKEARLSKVRESATKNNTVANEQRQKVDNNNKLLGLTEVVGEGIQIVLRDGDSKTTSLTDVSQLIVHDNDILQVINLLRNAGAEAISVNGIRIVANTSISCIGTVVLINNEKVGAPYNIQAIGDKNRLESAVNIPGGLLTILEKYGIKVTKEKKEEIVIPAYTGGYNYQYINEAIANTKKGNV